MIDCDNAVNVARGNTCVVICCDECLFVSNMSERSGISMDFSEDLFSYKNNSLIYD